MITQNRKKTMTKRSRQIIAKVAFIMSCLFGLSQAQALDELDVTMTMVGDDETLTETVAHEIRLPEAPADGAKSDASTRTGIENGNARREAARTMGERMAEQGRELRENRRRDAGQVLIPDTHPQDRPAEPLRPPSDGRP